MLSEFNQPAPEPSGTRTTRADGRTSDAPDGDGAGRVRGLAEEALRCALRGVELGGQDGELREALRRVGDSAQACGLRAEQLLILLKGGWRELPEARHLTRVSGSDGDGTLARVISLCIEKYYAPREQH